MLIGICGLIGNGKGTVADHLVENHKFEKLSFADSLKDGVSAVFGWDREMLEGETVQSRKWREEIDLFWTKETGREAVLTISILGVCIFYGHWRLTTTPDPLVAPLKALLVQGSIDTELKHDPDAFQEVTQHYDKLTRSGLLESPSQLLPIPALHCEITHRTLSGCCLNLGLLTSF